MFRFSLKKTLQASACLLARSSRQEMSHLRLLKLLYIADRESLNETGRPITGDCAVSMAYGPVLSRLYNIIKGEDVESPNWDKYVHKEGYVLDLVQDPGRDALSRYEAEKLTSLAERYREKDDWMIVRETHQFEEWHDPKGSSVPIALVEILEALSKSPEEIRAIEEDARVQAAIVRTLEDC